MNDYVALLGVKGGPAIRPGSQMPTSVLVGLGGRTILVDAGLGVARGVCDQGIRLPQIDAIFITHLHSDHYLELGPLLHTAWTAGLTRKVPIYGPAGLDRYWDGFLASMAADISLRIADEGRVDLAELADIKTLAPGQLVDLGGVSVSALRNDHPPLTDTYALRLDSADHSVCLSGDTASCPDLIDFARGADLLVHEAMLVAGVEATIANLPNDGGRLRRHILRSHTAAADVGLIAAKAGIGHLALNHLLPEGLPGFGEDDWRAAVRETYAGLLTIGYDGARVPL